MQSYVKKKILHSQISKAVREHFHICDVPDNCLERLLKEETLAVAISRLHAKNTPVISQTELFCFARSANIYSYSVAMPIKLDYHLLPQINSVIRQLFEFGLIERWDKLSQSIASSAAIVKMQKDGTGGEGSHLVVLTVAHIMGAILIMIFGHSMALIAFLAEHFTHGKIKKGNYNRFWMLLHKFLTPKRNRVN